MKKNKLLLLMCVVFLFIIVLGVVLLQDNKADDGSISESEMTYETPWENGRKQPNEYTWKEFERLSANEQALFQKEFENAEAFDEWMSEAQGNETSIPWEEGGKQPSEYTWEEFNELNAEQEMAFQKSFDSLDEFDQWLQKAQGAEE